MLCSSRFLVVQRGARRSYAVPLFLEQAGMLERLYTDFAGNAGLGRWLAGGRRLPRIGNALRRLHSRQIPPNLLPKTRTLDWDTIKEEFRKAVGRRDASQQFRLALRNAERWGKSALSDGFGSATHLYTMIGEGGPFVEAAHNHGLTVVSEIYIMLSTENIVHEERARFTDWEPEAPDYPALRNQFQRQHILRDHTDIHLCPSQTVADDLVANWGVDRDRTTVVPYGVHPRWLDLEPKPIPGRILFVGTAELRKGIHYLAMAAEKLHAAGHRYEFRIAGHVTDQVRRQPMCRHLTFLGRIPRDRIQEEFQQADVFVLPSLAEGSAEVTYEALAASLPIIVTEAAGSVARDGVEGLIVPDRDSTALANAIAELVVNRAMRNCLATNARRRASEFTWKFYENRLITALKIPHPHNVS